MKKKGTLYILLSAMLFSVGGLGIKLLSWGPISINGGRSIISVTVIGLFILKIRHKIKVNRYIMLGAVCMSMTTTFYVFANKLTTAANTIVLQFTAPIFIILYTWIFFKKRPKRSDVIACLVVFLGIICFVIDGLQAGGMLGNIFALLSGATFAGVFMLNTFPDADPLSSIIIGHGMTAIIGIPFILAETDFTTGNLSIVILLGAFQVGLAYILFSQGIKYTPPVTAALITGIEPVMNPMWVAIFYKETVSSTAIIGGIIVIVTIVVYNVLKSRRERREKEKNKLTTGYTEKQIN